jgi:hypothetical protein
MQILGRPKFSHDDGEGPFADTHAESRLIEEVKENARLLRVQSSQSRMPRDKSSSLEKQY